MAVLSSIISVQFLDISVCLCSNSIRPRQPLPGKGAGDRGQREINRPTASVRGSARKSDRDRGDGHGTRRRIREDTVRIGRLPRRPPHRLALSWTVLQPLADDPERPSALCRRRQSSERISVRSSYEQRRPMIGSAGGPQRLRFFPSSLAWVARACSLRPTDHLGSIASTASTTTPPTKERN